jgi:hypothetical protein
MQALDNFISPIPGFEGDIPILTITVLAQPPGGEVDSDPSTGASAGTLRTRVPHLLDSIKKEHEAHHEKAHSA